MTDKQKQKVAKNGTLYIGSRLRTERKAKGYTLKEVGNFLSEPYQQIAEVERGVRKASIEKLIKYFALYDINSQEVIKIIENKG